MKKKNKLSTVVFYTLFVMIVLLVVSSYLTSGLVARYSSSGNATDSARVALWDISFGDDTLQSEITSTHLEAGSTGSWGLDIVNKSEVAAEITSTSKVKLRVQASELHSDHNHATWNFLHDSDGDPITNPIRFEVYLYNCSYEESLVAGDYTRKLLLDTTTDLTFEMIIEDGVLYYETIAELGELPSDYLLAVENGKACIRVDWSVSVGSGQDLSEIATVFKSYHLMTEDDYNTNSSSYNGKEATYTIDGINYVIAYKEYEYFDYFIYTSSIGGEVLVTTGGEQVKASKLTSDQKNEVLARTDTTTLEALKLYVEKLQYTTYASFVETREFYEQETYYLNLGLECRILFDLKVEQVD